MASRFLLRLIRFYRRAISPWTLPSCRFIPTCSEYAARSVERHGALRGGALALKRILRCHPLGGAGWDPVPETGDEDVRKGSSRKYLGAEGRQRTELGGPAPEAGERTR